MKTRDSARIMTPVITIRLVGRSMRNQAVSIPDMRSLAVFSGISIHSPVLLGHLALIDCTDGSRRQGFSGQAIL